MSGSYAYVADYISGLQVIDAFSPLIDILYIDSGTITATVPAGMRPGAYNLHVTNPDGGHAILNNAFTVLEPLPNPPIPDIKANGQDGRIIVNPGENVTITLALDPGDMTGELADWWIGVMSPYGTFWLFRNTLPLSEVSEITIFDRSLPIGLYTFFFILDDTPDRDFGITWYDYVNVICKQIRCRAQQHRRSRRRNCNKRNSTRIMGHVENRTHK